MLHLQELRSHFHFLPQRLVAITNDARRASAIEKVRGAFSTRLSFLFPLPILASLSLARCLRQRERDRFQARRKRVPLFTLLYKNGNNV